MKTFGFLGPIGTYSSVALDTYISKTRPAKAVPYPTIVALYDAIANPEIDAILVPIENSIEGPVNISVDLLRESEGLYIKCEIILPIHNCLMARSSITLDSITHIWSHPQPLAQCRQFIQQHCPLSMMKPVNSSAAAADILLKADSSETYAFIGHPKMADLHQLKILATDINDYRGNKTSFFLISSEEVEPIGCQKTSVLFATERNEPGSLNRILSLFSDAEINLTKILSRPSKSTLGDYIFHVDLNGCPSQPKVTACLEKVESECSYFKRLGSYIIMELPS